MSQLKFKIVFIHGFGFSPESWNKEIFTDIKENVSQINYCIPGFGNTKFQEKTFKEISTDIVDNYLSSDCINIVVGHSMGGYIAMEFINSFPNFVQGVILVNSHPWADTEEIKEARTKQANFLIKRPVEKYLKQFYLRMDSKNAEEFYEKYSINLSAETLAYYHLQMRDRPNYQHLIDHNKVVFGLVLGKNDTIVDILETRKLANFDSTIIYVENEGNHMTPIYYPKDIIQAIEEMKTYLSFSLL